MLAIDIRGYRSYMPGAEFQVACATHGDPKAPVCMYVLAKPFHT